MRVVTKEKYINPDRLAMDINRIEEAEKKARKDEESKITFRPANAISDEDANLMTRIDMASDPELDNNFTRTEWRKAELMSEEERLEQQEEVLGKQYDNLISELQQDFEDKD